MDLQDLQNLVCLNVGGKKSLVSQNLLKIVSKRMQLIQYMDVIDTGPDGAGPAKASLVYFLDMDPVIFDKIYEHLQNSQEIRVQEQTIDAQSMDPEMKRGLYVLGLLDATERPSFYLTDQNQYSRRSICSYGSIMTTVNVEQAYLDRDDSIEFLDQDCLLKLVNLLRSGVSFESIDGIDQRIIEYLHEHGYAVVSREQSRFGQIGHSSSLFSLHANYLVFIDAHSRTEQTLDQILNEIILVLIDDVPVTSQILRLFCSKNAPLTLFDQRSVQQSNSFHKIASKYLVRIQRFVFDLEHLISAGSSLEIFANTGLTITLPDESQKKKNHTMVQEQERRVAHLSYELRFLQWQRNYVSEGSSQVQQFTQQASTCNNFPFISFTCSSGFNRIIFGVFVDHVKLTSFTDLEEYLIGVEIGGKFVNLHTLCFANQTGIQQGVHCLLNPNRSEHPDQSLTKVTFLTKTVNVTLTGLVFSN